MPSPVLVRVGTLYAGGFLSQGQSVTLTVHITQNWEINIPIGVVYGSNVSFPVVVFVYPSSDGGVTFDTEPLIGFAINQVASATKRQSIRLYSGQYAVEVRSSSPSVTVFALTQEVLTAIIS